LRRLLQRAEFTPPGKDAMKFEHFAITVPDAAAMARWYEQNCDLVAVLGLN
jgi:hypothetical protein